MTRRLTRRLQRPSSPNKAAEGDEGEAEGDKGEAEGDEEETDDDREFFRIENFENFRKIPFIKFHLLFSIRQNNENFEDNFFRFGNGKFCTR